MKKSILICAIVAALGACSGGHRFDDELGRADSLMSSRPDSAWGILNALDSAGVQGQRRGTRMRYELLRAEAQNKLYVNFTTDSVMRQVVRYYDRHGSANEQLKARYLLGCCYRDMHEAPIAILTWEEAVACADTLSPDCDYSTLYRVYGQMADLYMWQRLPKKQLDCERLFCKYALAARDTLASLRGKLHSNSAYFALGDTTAIMSNIENVRRQYLNLGLFQESVRVFPSAIDIAVESGHYAEARHMMDEYELHSGLFDEKGNIVNSRIRYHYIKGLYYLGVNAIDSAEFQFRKLLSDSLHLVDACRGLFTLYQNIHDTDSAFKYGCLYEEAMSRFLDNQNGEAIIQAQAMYDYQRQEKIAQQEQRMNQRLLLWGLLGSCLALAAVGYLYKRSRDEAAAKRQLQADYYASLNNLDKAKRELGLLRTSLSKKEASQQLLEEKEQQIRHLETVVESMQTKIGETDSPAQGIDAEEALLVRHLQEITKGHYEDEGGVRILCKGRAMNLQDWNDTVEHIQRSHPQFYLNLQRHQLSELKFKVCVLSFLKFKSSTIAALLDTSRGSVSNARSSLAKELFNLDSAYDLDARLRSEI